MGESAVEARRAPNDVVAPTIFSRTRPSARVVLARALRTGVLTALILVAMQPATWQLAHHIGGAIRSLLPVLAVAAALVLSQLGRVLVLANRWPAWFMRASLAVGWLLAGAVVARRTVEALDVDLAAVIVGALILPAKVLLRR